MAQAIDRLIHPLMTIHASVLSLHRPLTAGSH
uniref:Uncharacterized protein n=1 Tax=Zea mays TaxID=4577 RepID=C4J768_MAIZE|nr:unknown [Zea mays]